MAVVVAAHFAPLGLLLDDWSLSSGQSQLFYLTATLLRPANLMVLDEPEQRLDMGWRAEVAALLRRRGQDGTTLVLACHDPALTEAVADGVLDLTAS